VRAVGDSPDNVPVGSKGCSSLSGDVGKGNEGMNRGTWALFPREEAPMFPWMGVTNTSKHLPRDLVLGWCHDIPMFPARFDASFPGNAGCVPSRKTTGKSLVA